MTGSNKILTVSYGTFSCTLEGFDDPFGTMRGIAEYFRDLAADDRYFGAEPPTPDVEMLQNIAQKDVQRRVEAHVGETGIALRQVADATQAPEAPAAQAPETPAAQAPTPPPARPPAPKVEDAETLDSGPLAFDDEYLMADEPEDVFSVDTDTAPAEDRVAAETVAEKLRRIRAVVSKSLEVEEPQEPFSSALAEDDNAGADAEEPQKRSRALTATIASITADLSDEFETEDEQDAPEADDASPDDASPEVDPTAINNLAAPSDDLITDQDDDAAENAFDAIDEPIDGVEIEDIAEAETNLIGDDGDTASNEDEASFEDDAAIVASVTKIVASKDDDDDAEDDDSDAPDWGVFQVEGSPDQPSKPRPRQHTTVPLSSLHDSNGDIGRLLEETDQKLNDDDGIRRRRVISQMRAAVAATKADRIFSKIVSRETSDTEEQSPYRQDLNQVISRNPPDEDTNTAANQSRPAPLVLVSSQRVDTAEEKAAGAEVPPQRVEKSADGGSEIANFKDFATRMGATELPDLLEAAAAYSAFVEGEPHFSRPDIMKRVARADPARQLSRETGLRTFGQLLRQGKIQKLQRGQFAVADDTKFNPAQRIAGQ